MSKLTVIKQQYEAFEIEIEKEKLKLGVFTKTLFEDLGYLLSLLEEKDKALKEIANYRHSYKYEFVYLGEADFALSDCSEIARKALITSSNNEGEN